MLYSEAEGLQLATVVGNERYGAIVEQCLLVTGNGGVFGGRMGGRRPVRMKLEFLCINWV